MIICQCKLTGMSDVMFGKHVPEQKRGDETHEQREERTWQQKVHLTADGQCYLQPFALKNCLESAAKWLSKKIPGEGQKTYTKRFVSGVMVVERMLLSDPDSGQPLTIKNVEPLHLFVPSDGKRGGGSRVERIFPTVHAWVTEATIHVFDNKITEEVMQHHLVTGGKFVGFGSMRVENGGINGRYQVNEMRYEEMNV